MRPGKIAVYGVPTAAAARAGGVERASWVLRQEGLMPALRERGLTPVHLSDLSLFLHRDDPAHPRARNVEVVACAMRAAADEMTRALDEGFVLLLGGDCTMGAAAAIGVRRARGRVPGLVWLDANADLNTPETTPSGFVDGMALSLALGRGPAELAVPATTPDRVALLGYREVDAGERDPLGQLALAVPGGELKAAPVEVSARRALDVASRDGAPVVVHLDVDLIDPAFMPAKNGLVPGGLDVERARDLLAALVTSPAAVAVTVCGYDPERDPDRASARTLVGLIADALRGRSAGAAPS